MGAPQLQPIVYIPLDERYATRGLWLNIVQLTQANYRFALHTLFHLIDQRPLTHLSISISHTHEHEHPLPHSLSIHNSVCGRLHWTFSATGPCHTLTELREFCAHAHNRMYTHALTHTHTHVYTQAHAGGHPCAFHMARGQHRRSPRYGRVCRWGVCESLRWVYA